MKKTAISTIVVKNKFVSKTKEEREENIANIIARIINSENYA
ncbi:hypothetical protein [Sedimentibacter sp. zth1]|nr:hypothetical protein [Sedimentibacter sp. zth1]